MFEIASFDMLWWYIFHALVHWNIVNFFCWVTRDPPPLVAPSEIEGGPQVGAIPLNKLAWLTSVLTMIQIPKLFPFNTPMTATTSIPSTTG